MSAEPSHLEPGSFQTCALYLTDVTQTTEGTMSNIAVHSCGTQTVRSIEYIGRLSLRDGVTVLVRGNGTSPGAVTAC